MAYFPAHRRVVIRSAAVLLLSLLAAPALAQSGGPRPLRLFDLEPHNVFWVGSELGRLSDRSGLAFPVGLEIMMTPEVAFTVEGPFAYINELGQVATPVLGNVGVGLRASFARRMARRADLRYGVALGGRIPTAPGTDPDGTGALASRLRAITPYRSERWTPGSAALRLDLATSVATGIFAAQVELGGVGSLPLDTRAASVSVHYGLTVGARAFRGAWVMVELAGAEVAPGLPDQPGGHVLTVAPGLRLALGGVSPAFFVSFPIVGDVAGEAPIVFGLELAAF